MGEVAEGRLVRECLSFWMGGDDELEGIHNPVPMLMEQGDEFHVWFLIFRVTCVKFAKTFCPFLLNVHCYFRFFYWKLEERTASIYFNLLHFKILLNPSFL